MKSSFDKDVYTTVEELQTMGRSTAQFHTRFYPMAGSLVIFLLEAYGRDDFLRFCRQLRDGDSFYQALNGVYRMKGPRELDKRFLSFLESKS